MYAYNQHGIRFEVLGSISVDSAEGPVMCMRLRDADGEVAIPIEAFAKYFTVEGKLGGAA
jgi:hypothetical protein